MKQLLTILLLAVLMQTISCTKKLDKKSDTGLTTIDRLEDLQALLNIANATDVPAETVPSYGEASSDDYFLTETNFNNNIGQKGQAAYSWQYFDYPYIYGNDWSKAYYPVNIANICLEEIDRFPKTAANTSQWNNVKGSALFIRAFNFLDLMGIYAKAYDSATSDSEMGIALRLGTDTHVPTVRATVAECYGQIIKDAKESVFYLTDIAKHPIRPSKAAAYGLLARTYLSMRIYDSALFYADKCLQIRNELMDYNGDADIINDINGSASPFRKYNKETIYYADVITGTIGGFITIGNTDTLLYSAYSNDDLRKSAFFTPDVNGYQRFKGNYTQIAYQLFGGIATDEVFLIRAECYARKGMLTEAMNDLNALMIKRWNNTVSYPVITTTDATDALNKILIERRKELVFRGLRWVDIKRLNKGDASITLQRIIGVKTYELLPNSDKYALPIPEDIIRITGIPQNLGWQ